MKKRAKKLPQYVCIVCGKFRSVNRKEVLMHMARHDYYILRRFNLEILATLPYQEESKLECLQDTRVHFSVHEIKKHRCTHEDCSDLEKRLIMRLNVFKYYNDTNWSLNPENHLEEIENNAELETLLKKQTETVALANAKLLE